MGIETIPQEKLAQVLANQFALFGNLARKHQLSDSDVGLITLIGSRGYVTDNPEARDKWKGLDFSDLKSAFPHINASTLSQAGTRLSRRDVLAKRKYALDMPDQRSTELALTPQGFQIYQEFVEAYRESLKPLIPDIQADNYSI